MDYELIYDNNLGAFVDTDGIPLPKDEVMDILYEMDTLAGFDITAPIDAIFTN